MFLESGMLTAGETLALWERVDGLRPVDRALTLAAYDGADAQELATLPIGHASARLLQLRRAAAGTTMAATAVCPACSERMEFSLDLEKLLTLQSEAAAVDATLPAPVLAWRPPTWTDLEELADADEPDRALLRRCVTVADAGDPTDLPPETIEAIERAMMAADPLAEVLVALRCPECGLEFDTSVDLAEFVWIELDARAQRILHEVDVLARSYGWTEAEVLALSEPRRAAYLRLVLEGVP